MPLFHTFTCVRAGDNPATANAVARQVGILSTDVAVPGLAPSPAASSSAASGATVSRDSSERTVAESMTATDFLALSDGEQRVAAVRLRVLARVEPLHKQKLVELLQEAGEVRNSVHGGCTGAAWGLLVAWPLAGTRRLQALFPYTGCPLYRIWRKKSPPNSSTLQYVCMRRMCLPMMPRLHVPSCWC